MLINTAATLQVLHPSIRSMNQSVVSSAPCSFGILINRGLESTGGPARAGRKVGLNITIIFFGGPDDRECLAYASRMAGHPDMSLTLIRFVASASPSDPDSASDSIVDVSPRANDQERRLDEACIEELRQRWDGWDMQYKERVSRNAEETVEGLREMVNADQDLYIVGRSNESESPMLAGLTDWCECPELGPIGDLLSTSDFAATVSVLVLQQGMIAEDMAGPAPVLPESPGGKHVRLYVSKTRKHTTDVVV